MAVGSPGRGERGRTEEKLGQRGSGAAGKPYGGALGLLPHGTVQRVQGSGQKLCIYKDMHNL